MYNAWTSWISSEDFILLTYAQRETESLRDLERMFTQNKTFVSCYQFYFRPSILVIQPRKDQALALYLIVQQTLEPN